MSPTSPTKIRAVFLDRDGVINANNDRDGKPVAPTSFSQFRLLDGVEEAARRLKAAGFLLVVVTNQPDLATGRTSSAAMDEMHAEVRRRLPVDDIRVCPHVDADGCDCRKPKPGLLLAAARKFGIDLAASYMVGDRWRDVVAGQAAGCETIFVDYGYVQDGPNHPDKTVRSLSEAADYVLALETQR